MYDLRLDRRIVKEMTRYPPKIYKQVMGKIISLQFNPRPHDCKKVGLGLRVDQGEYLIYYQVDDDEDVVKVLVVGKRNNDEIYKLYFRGFCRP